MKFDVAIVGGGPSGSTTACLLKKYNPALSVAVFEREKFPRDHVGESQLPTVSYVLDEMGAWDKVEAANFPVKVGATYRWGKTPELWSIDFLSRPFDDSPRPAKFEGQRRFTAFQVDRAVYDKILLDHARELGCEVYEEAKVQKVVAQGDRVESLVLATGEEVRAKFYVDASGHVGVLRRGLGVPVEAPTNLQNVAVWDYWQNAEWAEHIGVGGTRIQIYTCGFGWIWFIPISPTRTSLGLVLPAEYARKNNVKLPELYHETIWKEERIAALLKNATCEGKPATTKDWSFVAERHSGVNWFLAGESSGFADPILSAGLNISQAAAREVAFSVLELLRGEEDPAWIRDCYHTRTVRRVLNHIRFAEYWYTSNTQFKELKEFTQDIAKENNLDLSPDSAWRWIAQGGFIDEDLNTGTGGFTLAALKTMGEYLSPSGLDEVVTKNNVFKLDLEGAELRPRANYFEGRVLRADYYFRGTRVLPYADVFQVWIDVLKVHTRLPDINREIALIQREHAGDATFELNVSKRLLSALEAMVNDGWVKASFDPSLPLPPSPKQHPSISTRITRS